MRVGKAHWYRLRCLPEDCSQRDRSRYSSLQCCDSCGYTHDLHINTHPHLNWRERKVVRNGGGDDVHFHQCFLHYTQIRVHLSKCFWRPLPSPHACNKSTLLKRITLQHKTRTDCDVCAVSCLVLNIMKKIKDCLLSSNKVNGGNSGYVGNSG